MGADEFLRGRLFQNETPAAVVILYEVFTTFRQIHTDGSAMLYLARVVPAEQLAGFSPQLESWLPLTPPKLAVILAARAQHAWPARSRSPWRPRGSRNSSSPGW
jgi:hypothetical protein